MGQYAISSLPWLMPIYHKLLGIYKAKQGHHALLISCKDGQGSQILIQELAGYLLCQQAQTDFSKPMCGICPSCLLINAGNHPDNHIITPEKDKKQIGIDAIRILTEKLYQHANQGGTKIVQIHQLETMTHAAMNALLKILEEPPEKTYFLLSTYSPEALLATIKSRCLNFPMPSMAKNTTRDWLKQQFVDLPEESLWVALKLAHGAPLRAKDLLSDDVFHERTLFNHRLQECLIINQQLPLLSFLTGSNWLFHFDGIISLCTDAMKYQTLTGAEFAIAKDELNEVLINSDVLPLIEQFAKTGHYFLDALNQNVLYLRHILITNSGLNLELLMTNFLLQWQQKKLDKVEL